MLCLIWRLLRPAPTCRKSSRAGSRLIWQPATSSALACQLLPATGAVQYQHAPQLFLAPSSSCTASSSRTASICASFFTPRHSKTRLLKQSRFSLPFFVSATHNRKTSLQALGAAAVANAERLAAAAAASSKLLAASQEHAAAQSSMFRELSEARQYASSAHNSVMHNLAALGHSAAAMSQDVSHALAAAADLKSGQEALLVAQSVLKAEATAMLASLAQETNRLSDGMAQSLEDHEALRAHSTVLVAAVSAVEAAQNRLIAGMDLAARAQEQLAAHQADFRAEQTQLHARTHGALELLDHKSAAIANSLSESLGATQELLVMQQEAATQFTALSVLCVFFLFFVLKPSLLLRSGKTRQHFWHCVCRGRSRHCAARSRGGRVLRR
eukprot:TRINITY_DN3666_c0_g1_i3.p1 TRINITY_DN3666_c0_g1~~TRINITY_DN3666_c0_g1_i3.p1  ORF type:complete len:434 (-),score=62.69 TRINITY_DN3666_c0_g1_i3:581-1735(-)